MYVRNTQNIPANDKGSDMHKFPIGWEHIS